MPNQSKSKKIGLDRDFPINILILEIKNQPLKKILIIFKRKNKTGSIPCEKVV